MEYNKVKAVIGYFIYGSYWQVLTDLFGSSKIIIDPYKKQAG